MAGRRAACAAPASAWVAVWLLMLAPAGELAAQGKRVVASDGWVKAGATEAVAFLAIENPTMYGIYVMSAASDVAGKVELRDASQSGDARLKPVEFISVPAYDRVDMRPNGVHLLLLDLKRPLKEGDRVALTLSLDGNATLEAVAIVRKE